MVHVTSVEDVDTPLSVAVPEGETVLLETPPVVEVPDGDTVLVGTPLSVDDPEGVTELVEEVVGGSTLPVLDVDTTELVVSTDEEDVGVVVLVEFV